MRIPSIIWYIAPKWALRRHMIPALEVSALRKVMADVPLTLQEKGIVLLALQRIRIGRPGAEAAMVKLADGGE